MLSGSLSIPTPAPTPAAPSSIVPAVLGIWQAGQVLAVDRDTNQMHVDHSPIDPELSDSRLMPYGQRIEFTNGYDKLSHVVYWQITWLVPYPPNACQYPLLEFKCSETNGVKKLDQTPDNMEFSMQIGREGVADFAAVGAPPTGRVYTLRCGGNDEWTPRFYVSKDRQRMWSMVAVDDFKKYSGLQEYHRVAEYKPRH